MPQGLASPLLTLHDLGLFPPVLCSSRTSDTEAPDGQTTLCQWGFKEVLPIPVPPGAWVPATSLNSDCMCTLKTQGLFLFHSSWSLSELLVLSKACAYSLGPGEGLDPTPPQKWLTVLESPSNFNHLHGWGRAFFVLQTSNPMATKVSPVFTWQDLGRTGPILWL